MPTGFNTGFEMFDVMQTIIPIFIIVVVGILIFTAFNGIRRWNYNNQQPVLTVDASIVSKRSDISVHHHHHNENDASFNTSSSTTYYMTFEVESGDRMEFVVNGKEYGQAAEGDHGKLTFQGTRYHEFQRSVRREDSRYGEY